MMPSRRPGPVWLGASASWELGLLAGLAGYGLATVGQADPT